jgi:putative membrane protein
MAPCPLAVSIDSSTALQLGALLLVALSYAWRARTLARESSHPVPRWRQASFYGGLVAIASALAALRSAARELLWAHAIQLVALGDLAAALIVLGLTAALLAPALQLELLSVRPFERLSVLCHPSIAFPLWAADLFVWQLSSLSRSALAHPYLQALEHALLLVFGVNMWMCLLGPLAKPRWFGNRARLCYALAVRACGAILGNFWLWTATVLYPYYYAGEAHLRISPVADQNIAGAIVLGEQALLTLGLLGWLFVRVGREREEHRAHEQRDTVVRLGA